MSWLVKLYETYKNCEEFIGKEERDEYGNILRPLLPLCHSTQTAHLEITIDAEGNFIGAEPVIKENSMTIIPCTEESANRTGQSAPHAMNDTIQYLAGDLDDKINSDKYIKYYNAYAAQLSEWHEYDPDNIKINAVLTYIGKKHLIQDLIDAKILLQDDEKQLVLKPQASAGITVPKIYSLVSGEVYKAFCRFNVYSDIESRTYKDRQLFDSWIKFQDSFERDNGLCYATGEYTQIASSHSKYIRNTGDGAKLISGNDDTIVTYRGRFDTSDQACEVGIKASNMAHSALKWLISRQGYKKNGHTILAWAEKNLDIPNPVDNNLIYDDEDLNDEISPADVKQFFAVKLRKKLAGYMQKLDPREKINVIALDAATPGRMSIIYYREMDNKEYFNNLEKWYTSCCWYMRTHIKPDRHSETKIFQGENTPATADIIQAAYGNKADDNIKHSAITRLLPCIIENAPIPADIVLNAVTRTSNREGYQTDDTDKNEYNWNKALQTTCALYKKYKIKEKYDMALDKNRNTRDYLYGRLLAVAENIESRALRESGETRSTAASRYFAQFAARPYRTWLIIYKNLQPYIDKLGNKAIWQIKLIDEIMDMFNYEDYVSDKQLSGEYLLGYHTQRRALYEKFNTGNTNDTNTNDENEGEENNE